VIQILLQIEEGIEEDVSHFATLQIAQGDAVAIRRLDHIQHLVKTCY